MKKVTILILSLLIALSTTACTGFTTFNNFKTAFFNNSKEQETTIKIGIYEPLSGEYKKAAQAEIEGIELAHDLHPEVCGCKVELIYADNKSNIYDAADALEELIKLEPDVILGSYGEVLTLAASNVIREYHIPSISITSSNPLITSNNPYYFNATFAEESQGTALADFAYTECGKNRIAIVKYGNDDTVTAEIEAFKERLADIDEDAIVADLSLVPNQSDFSNVLERIKKCSANAIYLALPVQSAIAFMNACENLNLWFPTFFNTRTWDNEEMVAFAQGNQRFDIAFCTDAATFESEQTENMHRRYHEKYGEDVEPAGAVAMGFDAYGLAIQAIQDAWQASINKSEVPSREAIKNALSSIQGYLGASGVISYNGSNEPLKTITIERYAPNHLGVYVEDSNPSVEDDDDDESNEEDD